MNTQQLINKLQKYMEQTKTNPMVEVFNENGESSDAVLVFSEENEVIMVVDEYTEAQLPDLYIVE